MKTHKPLRVLAAAAILTVGAAGCSSDDDSKAESTTTEAAEETTTTKAEETTTTEATSTTADEDEAEARAEAANLTIDDLPEGWTATPDESDDESVFDTCGDMDLDSKTVAKVSSDNFEFTTPEGGSLQLRTTSGVLTSTEDASAMLDMLATDEFAACTTDGFEAQVTGATVTGEVAVIPDSELPELADQVAALHGLLTISTTDEQVPMRLTVIALRTGDLVTTVAASAIGAEPDGALLDQVLTLVAERQAG